MKVISVSVFSALLCTVKEEKRPAFFGEDVHINIPADLDAEVLFRSRSTPSSEVVLLRGGQVVTPRGRLSADGHLVLEAVQEADEGTYLVRNSSDPADVRRLILIVRDCAVEQVVKYGDSYDIRLDNVQGPITLEFRSSLIQANESEDQPSTDPPAVVLYNQTSVSEDDYVGRLNVTEQRVTLHGVRMTDEGSFTVIDRDGKVRKRNCLNVREHQEFIPVPYDGTLKAKLYMHYSQVSLIYTPNSDQRDRVVVDRGVLVVPMDKQLAGRLSVDGSHLTMTNMRDSDKGMFKVVDLAGYAVAYIYPEVEVFKMPTLHTAILSLLGIIGVMLLACLASCQYKVYQRSEKSKRIAHIAEQAGLHSQSEGETFRQVVRDAYSRFTEESQLQSTWENATECTDIPSSEVTIRGLEVSRPPSHYHDLPSYKEFMQMSDSGVEFTSCALPLDTDSDATLLSLSHKPFHDVPTSPEAAAVAADAAGSATSVPSSPDATVIADLSVGHTPVMSAMQSASASPAPVPHNVTAATVPDINPDSAQIKPEGGAMTPSSPGRVSPLLLMPGDGESMEMKGLAPGSST